MKTFEHLAELHACATEEMPFSENVRAIEKEAIQSGFSLEDLRKRAIEIEEM